MVSVILHFCVVYALALGGFLVLWLLVWSTSRIREDMKLVRHTLAETIQVGIALWRPVISGCGSWEFSRTISA